MVRTRDFLLVLLVLAFGVVATGSQLFSVWFDDNKTVSANVPQQTPTTTYTAVISDTTPDYASRIALLRQKLALRKDEVMTAPETEPPEATGASEATSSEQEVVVDDIKVVLCSNYQGQQIVWDPQKIVIEDTPFSRLVVSLEVVGTTTNRVVRVMLPKPTTHSAAKNCIASDIVGVAIDGSLIRNSEFKLYGVFGEGTLVGYALDGIAIYGQSSNLATDACGGTVIDGVYRYYLSDERESIIGCYAGAPQVVR